MHGLWADISLTVPVPYNRCGLRLEVSRIRFRHCTALFLDEGRSMAPVAGHDEISELFAVSRGEFALLELVGQGMGVSGVADRHSGHGLPVIGNVEDLARFVGVEPGHLMNVQSIGDRLKAKLRAGAADVVKGVRVGLTLFVFD